MRKTHPASFQMSSVFKERIRKSYTPGHVANYVLGRAFDEFYVITQMKLQKLVYISYGWTLATLNKRLFIEPIYAWKHGPVIRSLYDEFKHYKAGAIDKFSMTYDMDSHASDYPRIPNKEKDVILVLDKVWEIYKDFKAVTLREKTHEEGTPWRETYKQGEGAGRVINDELIRSHFESKITEYLENARQLN